MHIRYQVLGLIAMFGASLLPKDWARRAGILLCAAMLIALMLVPVMGGAGNDTLTGGNGADVFKFLAGANGKDRITDFDARDGDKIDISDVLENSYDPLADLISQFAKIDRQGHNYTLSVDADGADNGANFTAIAVFDSHRQLTLESMIQNGSLIV